MSAFGIEKLAPASRHIALTPSNTVPLDAKIRSIHVLVGGDAILEDFTGETITYTLEAGVTLPFAPKFVKVGSTATLVGWF